MTFLPMDEVRRLGSLQGAEINKAKEVLAHELTQIVHGKEAADEAQAAAKALFQGGADEGSIPTTEIPTTEWGEGMDIISLMQKVELIGTRSEGRRLVQQGGVYLEGEQVPAFDYLVTSKDFDEGGELLIRKGKKVYHRVRLA